MNGNESGNGNWNWCWDPNTWWNNQNNMNDNSDTNKNGIFWQQNRYNDNGNGDKTFNNSSNKNKNKNKNNNNKNNNNTNDSRNEMKKEKQEQNPENISNDNRNESEEKYFESEKVMAEWVQDVTLPNGTYYPTDTILTKTWRIRNCGEIEWGHGVGLVFFQGNEELILENQYPVPVLNAQAKEEVEISVSIKTPIDMGHYSSCFRLQRNGDFFGPFLWIDIITAQMEVNKAAKKDEANLNKLQKNFNVEMKQEKQLDKQERYEQKHHQQQQQQQQQQQRRQQSLSQQEREQEHHRNHENEQENLEPSVHVFVSNDNGGDIMCMCGCPLIIVNPLGVRSAICHLCNRSCNVDLFIYHCPQERIEASIWLQSVQSLW